MGIRDDMLKSAIIGIASDFDEHVSRMKVQAAMESQSYVEVKEETTDWSKALSFHFDTVYDVTDSYES